MLPLLLLLTFLTLAVVGVVYLWRSWKKINQDQRRLEWLASRQFVVLMIEVPRLNDKTPLAAEQMFASLHGIAQATSEFQEHIGFEIVAHGSHIRFYVFCPVHLRDFVEGQIYAQYPTVEIVKVDDYSREIDLTREHIVGTELEMTKPDVYPIKTFANFNVDPLAGITAPLGKLADNEQVWIQILVRPVDDSWQARGEALIKSVRDGNKHISILGSVMGGITSLAMDTVREAASPGSIKPEEKKEAEGPKLSGPVESALKGIEEKITKLGFATRIRILAIAPDIYSAQSKVMSVVGAFKQFNTTNLNGFTATQMVADSRELLDRYAAREFEDQGLVLNIEELASLFHLPNITVETPNIVWTRAKKGEPPSNLPLVGIIPANDITRLGKTNFRNTEKEFGIKLSDRRRHLYTIGKSGTGKSTLLENMIIDDIHEGRGVILVDPHGDLYEHVLKSVPGERMNDVVLFDPSDRQHPIGFNLLENVDEDLKGIIASGFVGIFEKMFSHSWGPRLEHILRNTVLALLDYPNSTMLGIPKMLTDKKFRNQVVEQVKDPVIKDFWENEFASWDAKFAAEAVAPILNKVGQFISASTIRNIVAQPQSTFNVRQIMDEGKILLINLSRGKIGEDNSAMLGAMMITKIQLAAMSRADIPEEERTDCYLYVDEFQNFATRSFATILSESRKYRLNLTMANQYIAQMPEEVRDAVFGNVGTIIAFRVGASDATVLAHEFSPEFTDNDLVNQDIYKIYIKLSIDGLTGQAFSANTLPPFRSTTDFSEDIMAQSRQKYSRPREQVEQEIGADATETKPVRNLLLEEGTIALPPIKLNPSHIINGVYYKELHSTGGVRWWEGEPIEAVMEQEEKKRQKFLAKKIEHIKSGKLLGTEVEDEEENVLERKSGGEEPVVEKSENKRQDSRPLVSAASKNGGERKPGELPEKFEAKEGRAVGERVTASNSGIIANNSQVQSRAAGVALTSQLAQKNDQKTLNSDDQLTTNVSSQAPLVSVVEPHALTLTEAPDQAIIPAEQVQKAPSAPTIGFAPSGSPMNRPASILQHFLSQDQADMEEKGHDPVELVSKESQPPTGTTRPDELEEGVSYTI